MICSCRSWAQAEHDERMLNELGREARKPQRKSTGRAPTGPSSGRTAIAGDHGTATVRGGDRRTAATAEAEVLAARERQTNRRGSRRWIALSSALLKIRG